MISNAKTRAELTDLKIKWSMDPCWDIEDTPGFESYRDRLKAYRLEWEAKWTATTEQRLREKADSLGIPGNVTLARYIDTLEYRLTEIERKLDSK